MWRILNANDVQIPHGKHYKVSSLVRSDQNTHKSVKYSRTPLIRPCTFGPWNGNIGRINGVVVLKGFFE